MTALVREGTAPVAVFTVVAALSFGCCGVLAWRRRPGGLTAVLMFAAGLSLLATSMAQSDRAVPFTIGIALGGLPLAVIVHLLLAFPDERLHSTLERVLVVAAYLVATVLQLWMLTVMGYENVTGCPCPDNLLLVSDDAGFHGFIMGAQRLLGAVIALTVAAIVARRWVTASGPMRRAMGPLAITGGATLLLVGAALLAATGTRAAASTVGAIERIAVALLPAAYLLGLVRTRLARGAVGDLVVALEDGTEDETVRDALARALGDPSLEVVAAPPVEPPPGRAVTPLVRHGRPIAAIVHDPALLGEPALLAAAGAAAGLALENERRLEELQASRARIVEAGDTERRRLERNLHDGAQQRLVSLALALSMARERIADDPEGATRLVDDARDELTEALAELRDLAEGIHPAVLTDRGLTHALERLAERAPLPVELDVELAAPLPPAVEAAAYYVAAEALTNVAKYAQATRADVRVRATDGLLRIEVADDGIGGADPGGGSGLRGLDDRVQAFDGRLTVDSPPGDGTRVVAELPI